MEKSGKAITTALLVGAFLVGLAGCQKQEGPAEKAGKELDKAAEKVGQEVEKVGNRVQDAAQGNKK